MPEIELTLYEPNAAPRRLRFDADSISMGRTPACTIAIADRHLSRQHAEIQFDGSSWLLRDHKSVNGTFLNGARVDTIVPIKNGDRILLGSTEVVVGEPLSSLRSDDSDSIPLLSMSAMNVVEAVARSGSRATLVQRLAMELLEDRPASELFDVITERIMDELAPSRVALALLKIGSSDELEVVKLRRRDITDSCDLTISKTLLHEVVNNRNVVSFTDAARDDRLAEAQSIVEQKIRSAICAPLVGVRGVLGVLYIDYRLSSPAMVEEDAKVIAQIARIAAMKLESARLHETALENERLEETLRLARDIQMRMVPQHIPGLVAGAPCDIGARMRPARHVGGDFYDFHRAGSKLYFCIADVSGKGVPAALMMAVTRTLFRSMIVTEASPYEIVSAVNRQLCSEADPSMFVTAFCGVLDLHSGQLRYVNAGHTRPFLINVDRVVRELPARPGLALGCMPAFAYVEEQVMFHPGDLIYLYTDGITEATNAHDEMFSEEGLKAVLRDHGEDEAHVLAQATVSAVERFAGGAPQSDDLTVLCIRYFGGAE
jgi:sigma-B regulation protein RsbU (phosphoserine phosphatase)